MITTREFLAHVLPFAGPYCIAIHKGQGRFWQLAAEDIGEAASIAAEQDRNGEEVFFAVGALIRATVWDAKQQRHRVRRTGDNIRALRSYTVDMDAGGGRAYDTPADAFNDLVRFCKQYRLPKPTIVHSGNGLHIYWTLTEEVPQAEWEGYGRHLISKAQAIGCKFDSGRSVDSSSVLRVVGTRNNKYDTKPTVRVLYLGVPTDTSAFHSLLVSSQPTAHATSPMPTPSLAGPPPNADFGNNTNQYEYGGCDPRLLVTNCAAFRRTVEPGNQKMGREAVPEPAWRNAMQLAVFCRDGRNVAHAISNQDPRYTKEYVDKAFDRWTKDGIGPSKCSAYQQAWKDFDGSDSCAECPSAGKITSPIQVARYVPLAAPLVVKDVEPDGTVVERIIPDPPPPYRRVAAGIGVLTANTKTGADEVITFLPYDMYPARMQYDEVTLIEDAVMWRINMPHQGWIDVDIPHVSKVQLSTTLAKRGVHVEDQYLPMMGKFMTNYMRKLQAEIPREMAYSKMGWRHKGFILGDVLYTHKGEAEHHVMSHVLEGATSGGMRTEGTLDEWKAAAGIYNRPGLEAFRVFLYTSLGSVFYSMTGQGSTSVNATGKGGIGKSTVMDVAAAMWGDPKALVLRNTTQAAAEINANGLHHLPVMLDEITTKNAQDMARFIFEYSGSKGKLRSQSSGGIRADTATWSNICMTNANTDVYATMAAVYSDAQPHMMRLVQLEFPECSAISKAEADIAHHQVFENFGHAGRVFAQYIAQHETEIRNRIKKYCAEADRKVGAKSEERFWTAWIASVRCAAEIAFDLGLLPFPVTADVKWLYEQVDTLRANTDAQIETAEQMLSGFLDAQGAMHTLIISSKNAGNIDNVANEPRGELSVRLEADTGVAFVSRRVLQDYCIEKNINLSRRIEELVRKHIVINRNAIRVLGSGTKFATGRVRCLEVDVHKLQGKPTLVVAPPAPSPVLVAPAAVAGVQ